MPRVDQFMTGFRYGSAVHGRSAAFTKGAEAVGRAEAVAGGLVRRSARGLNVQ
jgi:hypothetical protein